MTRIDRIPGTDPTGQLNETELKLEQLAVLLNYPKSEGIPVRALAKAWKISPQAVGSRIGNAKRHPKYRSDLMRIGYLDVDFPGWWYSDLSETKGNATDDKRSSEAVTGQDPMIRMKTPITVDYKQGAAPGAPVSHPSSPFASQSPTSVPFSGTVPNIGQTSGGMSQDHSVSQPGASQFPSQEQVELLSRNNIYYVNGAWNRIQSTPQGSLYTPVDFAAELNRIKNEQRNQRQMDDRMKDVIKIIPLEFESIMKKVAFNPLVFQCYNYVNTVRDPETGADLYDGDFADYISWCVIWATEKFYGVTSSFITDLPSEYTRMKQIKKARRESNNPYYTPYAPSSINNPQARQIPYSLFPPPFKQKTEED